MRKKFWLRDVYCATPRRFDQAALVLAAFFVATCAMRFLVNPSGGHEHRQSDTMGMALRFAEEFRLRGLAALDFFLYPRIISSGLLDGINASEFPLLNVIGGFLHLTSADPFVGFFLTGAAILAFNLYVGFIEFPKLLQAWGAHLSRPLALLLWLCTPALSSQTNVIMPEGIAFPLMVFGAARILNANGRFAQLALGIALCNLGLSVKPTVVFVLGAVLFAPLVRERFRKLWPSLAAATMLSFLLPAWWYGVQSKAIAAIAQGPQVFAPAKFLPLQNLSNLGFGGVLNLLAREPYQGQLPMFVGWILMIAALYLGEWIPVLLYLLAIFGAAILGGTAVPMHGYYLIGVCYFSLLVVARMLGASAGKRALRYVGLACAVWGVLFSARTNIWVAGRTSQHGKLDPWAFGRAARPEIPPGYALITDDGPYPQKLLIVGRHGESAGADVFTACEKAGYAQLPLAILSSNPPPLGQVLCGGRAREIRHVIAAGMKWYITLIPGA